MIEIRKDYINYCFQRAEESFEDALILADKGHWNMVINRPYYACFYAVIALLLQIDAETKSHDGALHQFGLLIVKEELINKEYEKLYSKLLDARATTKICSTSKRKQPGH